MFAPVKVGFTASSEPVGTLMPERYSAEDSMIGEMTTSIDGSFTTNDGVKLRYEARGSRKPLVLVHGWLHSAKLFDAQLSGPAKRYRVFALDIDAGTRGMTTHETPPAIVDAILTEGGSHFMFAENPTKFNDIVASFVG